MLIRISNIDSRGFDIRLQQWDYQYSSQTPETVSYFALEKGHYMLEDGTQIEAGRFETDPTGSFGKFNFVEDFRTTPAVLASVSSFNEADAVTGRLRSINRQGFEFGMQEQEGNSQAHRRETIDYFACTPRKAARTGTCMRSGEPPKA